MKENPRLPAFNLCSLLAFYTRTLNITIHTCIMFYFTRKLKILDFKANAMGTFYLHTPHQKKAHMFLNGRKKSNGNLSTSFFLQTFNDQNTVLLSISLPFHIVIRHKVYLISCLHNYLLHGWRNVKSTLYNTTQYAKVIDN